MLTLPASLVRLAEEEPANPWFSWDYVQSNWSDIETAEVLCEHAVVSHGVYRYVRHPIYIGDIALLVGLELALNSWLVLGALAIAPIVV